MSRDVKALAVLIPYAVLVHPFNQFPADGETAVRMGNATECSHQPCSRPALHSLPWSNAHHLDHGIKRGQVSGRASGIGIRTRIIIIRQPPPESSLGCDPHARTLPPYSSVLCPSHLLSAGSRTGLWLWL
jgi:hypothetical protein